MGFPIQSEDCIGLLLVREAEHLPGGDYAARLMSGELDSSVRMDAIDWINKVRAYYSFGPLSAYLSINYLDRFLSKYELPEGKVWTAQLLSVSCLSLAAKMEETVVPLALDLQVGEPKFVFEARTIQRMELVVLNTLGWRMQAVTPFSFIDYFLHKFGNDNSPAKSLILRSVELILATIKEVGFLEFRPSEIAAAVALYVIGETQTMMDVDKAATLCVHINMARVLRCYEAIQRLALMKSPSVFSEPQSSDGVLDATCVSSRSNAITVGSLANSLCTPNGVLDAACLRSKSTDITVGLHASSLHNAPAKRIKLNRPSI